MNQQEMFGAAVWVGAKEYAIASRLRAKFTLGRVTRATLRVVGLGFFHCYLNGTRVGDDWFLPHSTDYEARPDDSYPRNEELSGHRLLVPEYDVTSLLCEGENTIEIHYGGGYYASEKLEHDIPRYGDPKVIWRIFGDTPCEKFDIGSSEKDEIVASPVFDYYQMTHECQDYTRPAVWEKAVPATPPVTEYFLTDCPADRLATTLPVQRIGENLYDCGENTTGFPVLCLTGARGSRVAVRFSEELDGNGGLCERLSHGQHFVCISDGEKRTVTPFFTWFGFRYFTVEGDAEVLGVEVYHTDLRVTGEFRSDVPLLDRIHDLYLHTQLVNMHAGIPSDCPHIERRGYTGDGQLCAHAAMCMLDARAFYRKWIDDIADCQDVRTGHIQYTAPYVHSGGGPGGWGSAILEVPYRYFKHYGDSEPLRLYYDRMLRYFDYLEAHTENGLVTSDKAGEWCLGEWGTPTEVVLPAPFVNNYFYVKTLEKAKEVAALLGKEEDIPLFDARIAERKNAIIAAYFNRWDGNFLGGLQGANAFALDIGLGDERTYSNTVAHYQKCGGLDTGIFGTELLIRLFFSRGDGELATALLLSESEHSFAEMIRRGATTLWEYFPGSLCDRSHNHPMFGAVVACFYDYLLGIRQTEDSAAYRDLLISPVFVPQIAHLSGARELPYGRVSVSYRRTERGTDLTVTLPQTLPEGVNATLVIGEERHILVAGENKFTV